MAKKIPKATNISKALKGVNLKPANIKPSSLGSKFSAGFKAMKAREAARKMK